jgi:hypothetical protein
MRHRKLSVAVLVLALLLILLSASAQAAPPISDLDGPSPVVGTVSPAGLLNPDGTLDLSTGFQGTLDLRGWAVTLDGERGPALAPASQLAAAAEVAAWNALPNQGLDNTVYALAVVGSNLYVGGDFSQTGDGTLTNLGGMAHYDTTTGTWHALSLQGLDNTVYALAVVGSDLYVGGAFSQTGDGSLTNLGGIARYDTSAGTWHALSLQGLDNTVYALAVVGSDLYVGGTFTQSGDGTLTNLGRMARYDTSAGTWHTLPHQGLNNPVYTLAVSGSDLYVGGTFTQTGDGALTNLGRIARYDTTAGTWHALSNQGVNSNVFALAVSGSDLYVGGTFTQTGDGALTNLGYIACYDTTASTWHVLPNQGLDNTVLALAVSGSDLYVGGAFAQTGDGSLTNTNHMARYDTTAGAWYALPNQGLSNDPALGLAVSGSDLYVGGNSPRPATSR